ncbi:hypothetical protein PIB30_090691 [Stylosanthes scabra]|uniref:Uncharacterized protein n=1 Tax=Stylosanthes scabra TaxID=79078 RepID=A0ABU6SUS0_9FABA|nr:hypothetical protein [Stylosanthes scabra]
MNKNPEEAWELIEFVADNNQHFKTRATTSAKGVFEVATLESTTLTESLDDIAAMLKEIKEGQQEDNVVASSHNFYEVQSPPPKNKQYCTQPQGWRDNQQNRWNFSQQQQPTQYRQQYTFS